MMPHEYISGLEAYIGSIHILQFYLQDHILQFYLQEHILQFYLHDKIKSQCASLNLKNAPRCFQFLGKVKLVPYTIGYMACEGECKMTLSNGNIKPQMQRLPMVPNAATRMIETNHILDQSSGIKLCLCHRSCIFSF